jgi:hypothetical protein
MEIRATYASHLPAKSGLALQVEEVIDDYYWKFVQA